MHHELEQIQQSLRQPAGSPRRVLADAAHADAALDALDALSYAEPHLSFIRDRVEDLRDSGADMQLIELAKWFERCSGDVGLPPARVSEMARLLTGATSVERLELRPDATEAEIQAAVRGRIADWRTFELGPGASPNERRAAAEVVRFYEEMLASVGGVLHA